MSVRSSRERLLQTAGYEVGGLLVATPVCAALTGGSADASALLLLVLTTATVLWAPLFNAAFDHLEWQFRGRVASARSQRLRVLHALLLEASDMVISVPILMHFGGLDLTQALVADLSLTVVYALYTYLYHNLFDWLRPVGRQTRTCAAGPAR